MKRQIIEINEDMCVGCGLCASACHQGAIQIIDGKAKLMSDSYCDGLGMCLPSCPVDAIKLTEKEAAEFDQSRKNFAKKEEKADSPCGCAGSMSKKLQPKPKPASAGGCCPGEKTAVREASDGMPSELRQWPVQLKLVSPLADFWDGADLLVAADCTAYAYANFHNDFIKGKVTVISCPKLDDNEYYVEKLTEIFKTQDIQSITVARMSVPCCGGIVQAVKQAIANSGTDVAYSEVTITPDGQIQ